MSMTPMSYECIECLLRHMEANTRIQISNRCPSLRELEKRVPLKIKSLKLMKYGVELDDLSYTIGIIRNYNQGRAPNIVARDNEMGGVGHEVDRYGIEDPSDANTVSPGDVKIGRPRMNRRGILPAQTEASIIRSIERSIQRCQRALAEQRRRGPHRAFLDVDEIEDYLDNKRAERYAWHCRQKNISPPYENFVQFSMTRCNDEQEQKRIERYVHNKKYSEAVKQLTTVLFGGRNSPIYVKEMILHCRQGVIRLPYGLKLYVQWLALPFGPMRNRLEALAPIIHETSYPFKYLSIDVYSEADITDPIVQSAERLELVQICLDNPLQILQVMSNELVRLVVDLWLLDDMERIVKDWIAANRPIGALYIFELEKEPKWADEMEDVLKRLNGVVIDEENVIIPMNDSVQLEISYGPFPDFSPETQWAFRFWNQTIQH